MGRHAQRRDKLRRLIAKTGADSLLVTNFTNVTYLTGFTGDDSYLLVTNSDAILLTDERYRTQLEDECPGLELSVRGQGVSMINLLTKVIGQTSVERMGIEASSMTVQFYGMPEKQFSKISIGPTTSLVEQLRVVKDKQEVQEIRQAITIAQKAFGVIRASMRPEQTEKEVADAIEAQVRRFGGKCSSFPSIVAVGHWAALPHAVPGERLIGDSPFVLIDWGARGDLYVSDLTRMLATGKIPPKFRRIYEIVRKANLKGIKAIRPGVTCEEVDRAARGVIEKAGFGKQFGHGLGHGIGLEVHEAPRLGAKQKTVLKPGMVITIEPGIYIPGWGGIRLEDDVLVTRDGHEVLTSVSKQLDEMTIE